MSAFLLLLKASVLLASTILIARLLRRGSATARHGLWSGMFAALLALPLLAASLPALHVPLPGSRAAETTTRATDHTEYTGKKATDYTDHTEKDAAGKTGRLAGTSPLSSVSSVYSVASSTASSVYAVYSAASSSSVAWFATAAWVTGTSIAVAALLLSLVRVRRLARAAEPLEDAAWHAAAGALAARLDLRGAPRLLLSGRVRTPMAGGIRRPVVFLPEDAPSWTGERRDIVLAHEMSHLARRDPLRHLAARLAVACYWFHPLAWLAARHSALAREQACDEAVLALGIRPSDYARVLLDLAEGMAAPRAMAALPMVERSLLETRLMAILTDTSRPARRRSPIVAAALAAAGTLALASAQPAARATAPSPYVPAAAAAAVSDAPAGAGAQAETPVCWSDRSRDGFRGYTNTNSSRMILEQIGTRGSDRIIQQSFGDLRICMVGEDAGAIEDSDKPSQWPGRAARVVIESRSGGKTSQLVVRRQPAGVQQVIWRVNGAERPFDETAQNWRAAMLAVLDATWELAMLRGHVSTLYGEISTLRGEESTLRGEIATLFGEISTMRGEQSTIRGQESTLRGEISTIRGHLSTLKGEISTERGSISTLEAARYDLSADDRRRIDARINEHRSAIAKLEREIDAYNVDAKVADVEKQIRALNADSKVAAIDAEIRKFDVEAKVRAIEDQIRKLDVDSKTAAIDRQIQGLDSRTRASEMESRRAEELKRLEKALAAIR